MSELPEVSEPQLSEPQLSEPQVGEPEVGEAAPAEEPGLASERDRLTRLLRETRLQLSMTQARLAAVEQSPTLELGRTLVRAARRPWPRGAQLPRDLYRMWRSGSVTEAPAGSPARLALASAQLSDLGGGGERMLSALTAPGLSPFGHPALPPEPGLVIAGVLTARTRATLAPDAVVQPLLPHDADVLLEGSGADLVLIEAAAVLAGSAWAYAVDPAAADRGRRLGRLIATARSLGKPVIFVRNAPTHLAPGLDWVAASCDAVSEDGFGVQLALFNPIGLAERDHERGHQPVYAAARDPREGPALRALLNAVANPAGPVQVAGPTEWRRLPELYRSHSLFVTAADDQARAQRASGARVIMAEGSPADLLARLHDAAPPDPGEVTATLRDIFEADATPVRLAAIVQLAGLPRALISGRRITVRTELSSTGQAQAFAAAIASQRLRPAEVVVRVDGDEPARRTISATLAAALPPDVAQVTQPGSPFIVPWDPRAEYAGTYLLDLACARECTQAPTIQAAGLPVAGLPAAKEQFR